MSEEVKESILKYLGTVSQARNKEVARAVGMEKPLVDKAIAELAKEDKIEYRSFGGITYIASPGNMRLDKQWQEVIDFVHGRSNLWLPSHLLAPGSLG